MAAHRGLAQGSDFDDEDVALAYLHRTAYPPKLCRRLVDLAPRRGRAIDLGCGPGKLAIDLADHFEEVLAVDPSAPMIALGRERDADRHHNIRWVLAPAEAFEPPPCDLVVAGASVHWMNHAVVFPRLAIALGEEGVLAVVDGDGPADAPWRADYIALLARWVGEMGGVYGDASFRARMTAHEAWMDVRGREVCEQSVRQNVEDLIASEHSRATWTRAKMGPPRAARFDADLRSLLAPYAVNGAVQFTTRSTLTHGQPRLG